VRARKKKKKEKIRRKERIVERENVK